MTTVLMLPVDVQEVYLVFKHNLTFLSQQMSLLTIEAKVFSHPDIDKT